MATVLERPPPPVRPPGPPDTPGFEDIIGRSEPLLQMLDLIDRVAASDANVLILGETGTGKELVANAIHERSRPGKAFVKINCAAVPPELIEAELFGYKKGAFTDATYDRKGLFELAENGSLLLDEIGEMPSYLQTKLLRVLQEREYRPVGGQRIVHVNFRLLTATNTDVACARREARLREDLYFRINTVIIQVTPLRERTEDIPLLCEHFLEKFRQRYQKAVGAISPAAASVLKGHRWPGNVRELEHTIERGVVLCKGTEIGTGDLPDSLRQPAGGAPLDFVIPPERTLAEIEKTAILQTLSRTNWNKSEAAGILGLHRQTLDGKMKKHGIRTGQLVRPPRDRTESLGGPARFRRSA
jgi:transcriptional regulator with PAS, ATPase and Fis domain